MLIQGGARCADLMAAEIAREFGWPVVQIDANWNFYHKAARPVRNGWMLALEPDICLAFHEDITNSKGTKDMMERARKAGVPVELIS